MAKAIGTSDAPAYRPARTGELQRVVLDVKRAERHMGWIPMTTLERGLTQTIEWIRATQER
jgi:UDP-glucose 4-epimerase